MSGIGRLVVRPVGPGEAGDGKTKPVPEEVHRTRLAVEPAAELLEHQSWNHRARGLEALDELAVPGLGARGPAANGVVIGTSVRLRLDLDVDAEFAEPGVELGCRNPRPATPSLEREPTFFVTVSGPDDQGVIEEVDRDLERRVDDDASAGS